MWQNQSTPSKRSALWEKEDAVFVEPDRRQSGDGEKASFDKCAPGCRIRLLGDVLPSLPTDVSTWQGC